MTDRLECDISPSERTAIVTLALARGCELTPADVAELTDCELRSGYRVLERLSRIIPLREDGGRWSLFIDDLSLHID